MIRKLLYIIFFACSFSSGAQSIINYGTIEFECKTNNHKLIKEQSPEWFEQVKDAIPKFSILYNNLSFDSCRTIYFKGRESDLKPPFWGDEGVPENYIYSDHASHRVVAQKEVFDQTFLVSDSTRKIKWKLTNDSREICGYNCRKATAIIMDSVYVIAYYTDQIVCPGGPEGINGLPGMILGMVVPRIHCTWFATKVDILNAPESKILVAPKKGKKATTAELTAKLKETFKRWGASYIISFLL